MIYQRSFCQSFLAKTSGYSEIMLGDEYQSFVLLSNFVDSIGI